MSEVRFYPADQLTAAWQCLPGGPEARDPTTDEAWQYMESRWDGQVARHRFRHRNLRGLGTVCVFVDESDTQCKLAGCDD